MTIRSYIIENVEDCTKIIKVICVVGVPVSPVLSEIVDLATMIKRIK